MRTFDVLPIRIILVYEEVPEQTTIFDLTIKDQEILDKLLACHGVFGSVTICTDSHSTLQWLRTWLEEQKQHIVYSTRDERGEPLLLPIKVDTVATIIMTGWSKM